MVRTDQTADGNSQAYLSQQYRLLSALIYLTSLLILARYLNGQFLPPYGIQGLWFYSGAAVLLLADFMLEPYFTRPVDALASAFTVLIPVATLSGNGAAISDERLANGRSVVILLAVAVIIFALTAIAFKDSRQPFDTVAQVATALVGRFARARWLFSMLLLAAGFAAFADSAGKIAALYLTWFVIVGLRPVEGAFKLAGSASLQPTRVEGEVEDLHDPGIVGVRLRSPAGVRLGTEVRIGKDDLQGTVVDATNLSSHPYVRVALKKPSPVTIGTAVKFTGQESQSPVIGHIDVGTNIDEVVFKTGAESSEVGLVEGCLVEVDINEAPTLYQVVSAQVVSRSDAGIHRQLIEVRARKLGTWSEERADFEHTAWVPDPGSVVRLLQVSSAAGFDSRFIGRVPGTTYGVSVDPHLAVTHNTAILGIMGIGKTHLAYELIRRMLVTDVMVVVLDISGRYSGHFSDICAPDVEEAIAAEIERRIEGNFKNADVREGEAGNVRDFEAALKRCLRRFVEGDERLLILNPDRFKVDRMDGRPFQGQANSMVDLTMVDVTRLVAEQLLSLSQELERDPNDENASICLVLEEAHSLIPEWNSVAVESDKQAVNATSRAVLQGRKYGFGCLLVTQRTANVTKSILNQCNTVFGMRSYDATGMGFLENYIGSTYSQLLASLQDREAVVFGRASSCASPLVVGLNDKDSLLEHYWAGKAPDVPVTGGDLNVEEGPTGTGSTEGSDGSDLPL